jgi:hypothetical protein
MAETIKVYPGVDGAGLRHPTGGPLKGGDKGTLWPSDQFTHRRIGDGSLTTTAGGGVTSDVGTARQRKIDTELGAASKK